VAASSASSRRSPAAARWASPGAAKCGYVVDELGFDACVDHRAGTLLRGPATPRVPAASTSTSRTSAASCSTRCCA
jgi:hypothetical protein